MLNLKMMLHSIKIKLRDFICFILNPLDSFLQKRKSRKLKKHKEYAKNMLFEEIARRFVKAKLNYMIKYGRTTCDYIYCNKKGDDYEYYENDFILSELTDPWASIIKKDKYLRVLYYSHPLFKELYRDKEKWIKVENALHELVKLEFERKCCKTEYIDESNKCDKYLLDRVGYVKTLRVSLK